MEKQTNYMSNYMSIICFSLCPLCNIPSFGGAWGSQFLLEGLGEVNYALTYMFNGQLIVINGG